MTDLVMQGQVDAPKDDTEFSIQLEKAAILFLNLLQDSANSEIHLSSIKAVCQIIQHLYNNDDLRQMCRGLSQEKATQTHNAIPLPDTKTINHITTRQSRKSTATVTQEKKTHKWPDGKVRTKTTKHIATRPSSKRISTPIRKVVKSGKSQDTLGKSLAKQQSQNDSKGQHEFLSPLTKSKPETLTELQCPYCYKEFIDKRNLKSHLWVHERKKSFECDVCNKLFLRSHQLTRHKRVHTGEKPYPCPVCGKAFADVSNLNTHKRKEHPDHASVLRCRECGKECQSKRDLLSHQRHHEEEKREENTEGSTSDLKEKKRGSLSSMALKLRLQRARSAKLKLQGEREAYLCQICGKALNKRAALLAHMKRHIRKKGYRCEYCNKVFTELRDLKVHLHIHTGERPYKCEECGKGFKSQGTLRSHLGVHSGVQRYCCDVCGRTFSQTSGLNLHKLKHTAEEERTPASSADSRQHNCDICGRCYKTKFRLQVHMKSHDSMKDVSCDFCEKKFQTSHDLAIHRRSHTKDKYLCRMCGATFKSRSVYYFHMQTHEIDRPHLCSVCGKSFVSVNALSAHKRRHVPAGGTDKSNDRFICTVCGRIYQMKHSLTVHMKIHQGIFDHPCDFCEKKFKSPAELRHHRRVHTQEKPYVCETCNRCFSRHSTLVNHRRTHSGERPYLCVICGAAFKLSCTLKKHAKIHTRETIGGKARSGRSKVSRPVQQAPPTPQDLELQTQQLQPALPQDQQLQHQPQLQLQQLPQIPQQQIAHPPASIAVPQIMAKPSPILMDSREQAHFIHELKPTATSIIQGDNSSLIHDRANAPLLLDPRNSSATVLQQQLREPEQNEMDDRDTRNLIEFRSAVPNSVQYNLANNTFTTYYYY